MVLNVFYFLYLHCAENWATISQQHYYPRNRSLCSDFLKFPGRSEYVSLRVLNRNLGDLSVVLMFPIFFSPPFFFQSAGHLVLLPAMPQVVHLLVKFQDLNGCGRFEDPKVSSVWSLHQTLCLGFYILEIQIGCIWGMYFQSFLQRWI